MEHAGIMLTVILVLVSVIFGLLLALNYKLDKLHKAVHEMKRFIEK
jgi:ABC-type arginine/histidine transport system permease subunit